MLPLAHALVGKQDLPIDTAWFVAGAAVVLAVSFMALSVAWSRPRFEDDDWAPVSDRLSSAVVNPFTKVFAGALGVFLLGVAIWSGITGTEAPDRNFSLTFVFVTVWIGAAFVSVFLGDVFRAFNPWAAIARSAAGVFRLIAGQSAPAPLRYPERLGRWPAVIGIGGFVWLELVYGSSGFQAVGLVPHTAAVAALVYTAWTFVGMALFGIDKWLERGEAFSVYFGMFSRLSPLEVRDGKLGTRRPLAGATGWGTVPGSLAMVLLAIGATAFDGAQEGLLEGPINDTFEAVSDAGIGPIAALRITGSLYLVLTMAVVAGIYWAGIAGMHTVRTSVATGELGRRFAHTFIPIAFAYLVAHYFTLLLYQEQAQFTYLLSDPLGEGSDYFGTAGGGIDYRLIGANAVWLVQVAALVVGHVTALVLGHDRALAVYKDVRTAASSQYWMLALMVGFTTLGLFLLSQANQ
jgi:hypothetical protein